MAEIPRKTMTHLSQQLRHRMTKEERHLWYDYLKTIPQTVNRQKVIGPYIVDFYCASAKIVIEIDGTQHYESDGIAKDAKRAAFLLEQGFTVLRYSNHDIHHNFSGVCEDIAKHLHSKASP